MRVVSTGVRKKRLERPSFPDPRGGCQSTSVIDTGIEDHNPFLWRAMELDDYQYFLQKKCGLLLLELPHYSRGPFRLLCDGARIACSRQQLVKACVS